MHALPRQQHFFSRYHKIIRFIYCVIAISGFVIFGLIYHDNHQALVQSTNLRLFEHQQALTNIVRTHYDAIKALQRQARTFLNLSFHLFDADINLVNDVNQNIYYLDVAKEQQESYAMLVGMGHSRELSSDLWQELMTAFSLNPLMGVLKNSILSIESLNYTSKKHFFLSYPYDRSLVRPYELDRYQQEYYTRALPKNNPEGRLFWTDLFYHSTYHTPIVTGAIPIYKATDFKGTMSIDFNTKEISRFFEQTHYIFGHLILSNEFQSIIGQTNTPSVSKIFKLSQTLPKDLSIKDLSSLHNNTLTRVGSYWVWISYLDFTPWQMIYYCHNHDIILYILRHTLPSALAAIIIVGLFLIGANRLISKEFIKPTNYLVNHIILHGQQSAANLENIKEPWLTWFDSVTKVFNDNRQLVDKLESHIHRPDDKVTQRTKNPFKKNKKLEQTLIDLKKAQNQIIVQEKLAGLGAVTAGIAHEIRNPLNFVLNFAETSKMFCEELIEALQPIFIHLSVEQRQEVEDLNQHLLKNMDLIREHGMRADSIVRGMLSHARGGEDVVVAKDINSLIQENLSLALAGYKSRKFVPVVQAQYDLSIPKIKVFAQDLGRVFLNIFNNACYALFEKFHDIHDQENLATITVIVENLKDSVKIIIKDNGTGIPKQIRQKIFSPFFTTKPTGEGTGLGLSMSYNIIVTQHKGSLNVHSEVGQSTTFEITLPITI